MSNTAESTTARVRRGVAGWPAWKRDAGLTKHSPKSLTSSEDRWQEAVPEFVDPIKAALKGQERSS